MSNHSFKPTLSLLDATMIVAGSMTFIVTLIYISTNLAYTAVLPLHDIATAPKDRVGVAASEVIFGNAGTIIIALMIMVSNVRQ